MRHFRVLTLLVVGLFLAGLALAFPGSPVAAEEPGVSITQASLNKQSVVPGASLRVTFAWEKIVAGDRIVSVQIMGPGGGLYDQQNVQLQGTSGTGQADFTIGSCAVSGTYSVTIQCGSTQLLVESPTFAVEPVTVSVYLIGASPAVVKPGGQVTVSFDYTASAATIVDVAVGSLVNKAVSLAKKDSWTSQEVKLSVPENAGEGKFDVTVSRCGQTLHNLSKAIEVRKDPVVSATITAPTQAAPASVKPASVVRVSFRYTCNEVSEVDVKILKSDGTAVASTKVALAKSTSTTTKNVDVTVPSGTPPGKYDVAVTARPSGEVLKREKEAVRVIENASVTLVKPKKASPVLVGPGDKVTVNYEYTAANKVDADVKIVKEDGASLVSAGVVLDKTSKKVSRSVTLTVPSNAAEGKYAAVVAGKLSGAALAEEKEAVLVEVKVDAAITSPTRAKPAILEPGEKLSVAIEYTAAAATEVELRLVGSNGATLVTRKVSLSGATTKRTQTVSFSLPSTTAWGKYNVVLVGGIGGKTLVEEKEAVLVETRIEAGIIRPTHAQPLVLKPGEKLSAVFEYTADTAAEVDLKLVGAKGDTLVAQKVSLSRATSKRTQTVALTVPSSAAEGKYDVVVAGRISGKAFDTQREAVRIYPYPVGVTVKFTLGQAGRWVDGTYQATDYAPLLRFNRTLLPIRHLGEPLGWELKWDGERKMATVIKGNRQVRVWVDHPAARISTDGGKTWEAAAIDPADSRVVPVIESGRTMLPLRFVAEALNTGVHWDGTTKTVTVTQ